MPHTLYYTPLSGNSFKPAMVARHLGLTLNRQCVDVLGGENRQPAFLAVNPRGQLPYLVTEDGQGLGESNAIAWFLAEGSPLIPATPLQRARALQWMIFEQTALEPFISPARIFVHLLPDQRDAKAAEIERWQAGLQPGLARLDAHLRDTPFIAGERCTVADIAVFGYTHLTPEAGVTLTPYPAIEAWIDRTREALAVPSLETLLPG
ncbi:MAG: glutathione S-transferase family protein [Burkholderiaceae bacterium]